MTVLSTILAALLLTSSVEAVSGTVSLPPGKDASDLTIEVLEMDTFFHPLPDGSFDIPFEGVDLLLFSDGLEVPTLLFESVGGQDVVLDAVVPPMQAGTYATRNLFGQTAPGVQVFVLGTTATDYSDANGNYRVYPTLAKDAPDMQVVMNQPGMNSQTYTFMLADKPPGQAHSLGLIDIVPSIEFQPITEHPLVEAVPVTAPSAVTVQPSAEPTAPLSTHTPVHNPMYGWAAIMLVLMGMGVLSAAGYRKRKAVKAVSAELLFHARMKLGKYDPVLTKNYRSTTKELDELLVEKRKLKAQLARVLAMQINDAKKKSIMINRLEEAIRQVNETADEARSHLATLKDAMVQDRELGDLPEAIPVMVDRQTTRARQAIADSEKRLKALNAARREVAGM
jgi:hypothetical protein